MAGILDWVFKIAIINIIKALMNKIACKKRWTKKAGVRNSKKK